MRPSRLWLLVAALAAAVPGRLPAQLDVRTPLPPSPVPAEGTLHLAYELHVTNFTPGSLTLTAVEALDAGSGRMLAGYRGDTLAGSLRVIGAPADDPAEMPGGTGRVVFVWVTVEPGSVPASIRHRIGIRREGVDGDDGARVIETDPIPVGPSAVVIGPPLRGDNWFAANGPDNATGHRRALIPVGGQARIAQRFAIDWVQVIDGATTDGDREDNTTYHAWGADAIAAADGIVAAVKDSIPENVPGLESRAVPITLETIGGNYVMLDIGGGRYAFYAHLQPGSLRVRVGDRVRRGQVLGLVGNSGNSTEPHLHFHVADRPSPLGAEGVPYVFDAFAVTGRADRFGAPLERRDPVSRTREIPLANRLVRFPGAR